MASCVSARSPATSTILIVTGLFGIAGACAAAGPATSVSNAAAPSAAAAMRSAIRRRANPIRSSVLHELMLFLLREYVYQGWRASHILACVEAVGAAVPSCPTCSAAWSHAAQRGRRKGPTLLRRAPAVVKTALKFAHDAREMPVHCGARALRVARCDGIENCRVIADRFPRKLRRMKMSLQAPPQFRALVPQPFDHKLQRAVARRLGDAQVEFAVARLARREIVDVPLHVQDAPSQVVEVGMRRHRCRHCGDLALDELARLQQLERSRPCIARRGARGSRRGHEDPGPDANLDQPAHFQRNDRLAHRCAAYAERSRQLAFRRQPRARQEFAARDQLRDLVRDLPVEPAWLDRLQGQVWDLRGREPASTRGRLRCPKRSANVLSNLTILWSVVKWPGHLTNQPQGIPGGVFAPRVATAGAWTARCVAAYAPL